MWSRQERFLFVDSVGRNVRPAHARTRVGAFFAGLASSEAHAALGFRRVRSELAALGAPYTLLRDANESAREAIVHTRLLDALAARYGAGPVPLRIESLRPRDRLVLAIENVTLGCVRKTYASLESAYQAEHSTDAMIRETMGRIAREQARQSSLAFGIADFLATDLSVEERTAISRARDLAILTLRSELERPRDPSLIAVAGLPSADLAMTLVGSLDRSSRTAAA